MATAADASKAMHVEGGISRKEDKLWRFVFSLQQALTEITTKNYKNRREQVLAVLWAIVDGIQFISLMIGRTSGFDPQTTKGLLGIIDFHILFTQHSWDSYSRVFWAYFVLTLFSALSFLYYLYRQRRNKGREVQIWFSIATRTILYGLFVPYVKLFASVFACGQDDFLPGASGSPGLFVCLDLQWTVFAAIAGGCLALFLAVGVPFFFLFRHNHIGCPDFESRPHGRFHGPYTLARVAAVAVAVIVPKESTIASLILLACSAGSLYLLIILLPSYRSFFNYARGGMLSAAAFLALASCVLTSVGRPGEPARALGSAVSLALAPFAFALGLAVVHVRYWLLRRAGSGSDPLSVEYRNPYEAELAIRLLLQRDAGSDAVNKAEAMYRSAVQQFPDSAYLQLQLAHFLKSFCNNVNAAHAELKLGWRREPALDYRYELHSTLLFWERQAALYNSTQASAASDIFNSADAKKQYETARQGHTRTLKLTRAFWIALTKKNLHVVGALDDVPRKLADIAAAATATEATYLALIKRFSNSKILLRSYGAFLEQCMNDKPRAQLYYMKADEVEENESKTASMSASQSQSQSQSQSAGGGMQSASESQSASSGASSSAAAKKRALNKELRLKASETKAVKRLFWGVVVGLLLLAGLGMAMFVAVKLLFGEYTFANDRLRFISFQRRRVVAVNNMVRWMHLGARHNDTALFTRWAGEIGIRSKDFSHDHKGLYFGYAETGMPPASSAAIVGWWKKPTVNTTKYFPGPPVYQIHEGMSIWDAGNAIMLACRRISLTPLDSFREISSNKEVRFIFQNALFGLLDSLNEGAVIYEEEVMGVISKAQWVLLAICVVSVVTLVCEALFVFRPNFARVRVTMRGTSDILEGIPRALLKTVAKHYTKVHKRQQQEGSEQGSSDEEGRGTRKGSSDSEGGRSDASDRSERSDRSDASGRSRRRARRRSAAASSGDEKTDKGSSSGEEEEGRGRRGKKRSSSKKDKKKAKKEGKRGRSPKKGGGKGKGKEAPAPSDSEADRPIATAAELPASPTAALAPVPESAEAAGAGGSRAGSARTGGSRASTARRAAGSRVPSLAIPGESQLQTQLQGEGEAQGAAAASAAGSGRSSAAGYEAPAVVSTLSLGGEDELGPREVHQLTLAGGPGADVSPPASTLSSTNRLGTATESGKRAAGSDEAGGSGQHALILALLQDDSSQSRSSSKGGSKPKAPAGGAAAGKGSDGSASSDEDPKLQLQLGRGGHRRQSVASSAPSQGGAPGGGILRRPSMQAIVEGHTLKLEGPHEKDVGEKAGKKAAEGEEEDKEKSTRRKEKEERKKEKEKAKEKKKDAAAAGEGHGPDILTLLTRKYTVAFIVIAGIFIVNFIVCFVILGSGRNFALEINLGGRRRSIAREVAFYARELYINDDLFLPRRDVYERLVKKSELFKQVHQALKFGDPELNVYGANGRNKALDRIMYEAPCLRVDAKKCVDGRVEDMQLVVNGLDALVVGVLDLVVEVMQEAAPDLLLTGKEDPKIAAEFRRNYDRLNSAKLTLLMEIDDGDLDDGLAQAAAAIIAESQDSMAVVELMEALILTFVVIFLLGLYLYLFAPMLARLGEETGRAGQILKMIPKDVVLKCTHLHHYFIGIGQEDDE